MKFSITNLVQCLPVLLGIPLNGVDPALSHLGTKSGSRKVFREAGVALPEGAEDLRSENDVVAALDALRERRPGIRRAVLKLDNRFSGEGNAIFRYPKSSWRGAIRDAMADLTFSVPTEPDDYRRKFAEMGGIVEEILDYPEFASPSVQMRIDPHGEVVLLSTHDQILGGPSKQAYEGCRFPAAQAYRRQIQEAGRRIGAVLASKGVVSRFGIDFFVGRNAAEERWRDFALEINLRIGGTTHPYLALQFLTGGKLDPETGTFHSPSGLPKFYRSTDNLKSDAYRGLLPEDLIDIMTIHRLHYSHASETGVLFHMLGALSQFGKLGLTAIGNSPEQADAIYEHALEVLDRESRL